MPKSEITDIEVFAAHYTSFFTELEKRAANAAINAMVNFQCTHVGCDRGLDLHECPDNWRRTKTGRLAYSYGGINQYGKRVGIAKITGIKA